MQQYLTTDQYKQALQQAISQNIPPDTFLKTITDNGVVVQGYNDQQFNLSPQGQGMQIQDQKSQTQQGQSITGKVGSFLGNVAQSIASPFTAAVGSGLRAIQSIPETIKQGFQLATSPNLGKDILHPFAEHDPNVTANPGAIQNAPILNQKTFMSMNSKELLGNAAKAGSFLAPGLGLGSVGTGAVAGGAFAAGDSASQNKTGNEIVGSGVIGAIGGAILGKVFSSLAGKVSGEGGYTGGVNSAEKIIERANAYRGSIPQDLISGAESLTQAHPDAVVSIASKGGESINIMQRIADLGNADINQAMSGELTPSAIQTISSKLNTLASHSGDKMGMELYGLNNEFRSWATSALNEVKPGVGDALTQLYKTASDQYGVFDDLMKTLDQTGSTGKPVRELSKQSADQLIKDIQTKASTPQGKIVLQRGLQDWMKSTGIDLSNEVARAQYVAKVGPAAGKILKAVLQYAGFGTAAAVGSDIMKHL